MGCFSRPRRTTSPPLELLYFRFELLNPLLEIVYRSAHTLLHSFGSTYEPILAGQVLAKPLEGGMDWRKGRMWWSLTIDRTRGSRERCSALRCLYEWVLRSVESSIVCSHYVFVSESDHRRLRLYASPLPGGVHQVD